MDKRSRHHGRAFTLVELLVTAVIMTMLTLMTAQVWRYFSVEMTNLAARARVAQELRFAMESICEDLGATVGAVIVEPDRVRLCKDAGAQPDGVANWAPPDIMVEYYLVGTQLIRYDTSSGSQIVMADSVNRFHVDSHSGGTEVLMGIKIRRGDHEERVEHRVHLIWSRP